jgi:hypothetical protein
MFPADAPSRKSSAFTTTQKIPPTKAELLSAGFKMGEGGFILVSGSWPLAAGFWLMV